MTPEKIRSQVVEVTEKFKNRLWYDRLAPESQTSNFKDPFEEYWCNRKGKRTDLIFRKNNSDDVLGQEFF